MKNRVIIFNIIIAVLPLFMANPLKAMWEAHGFPASAESDADEELDGNLLAKMQKYARFSLAEGLEKTNVRLKNNALIKAVLREDRDAIITLLREGVDINESGSQGFNALQAAINANRESIIPFLLDQKADIERITWQGKTVLHETITSSNGIMFDKNFERMGIAEILLMAGANINHRDNHGLAVFDKVSAKERQRLIERIKTRIDQGETPKVSVGELLLSLHRASEKAPCAPLRKCMHGVSQAYFPGFELLSDEDKTEQFLKALGRDEASYPNEQVALQEIIRLLDAGVDVNRRGQGGCGSHTPLSLTLIKNRLDVAEYLIQKGADMHLRGGYGKFPLAIAIEAGNLQAVRLLLRYGVKLEIPDIDDQGSTPVHTAAYKATLANPVSLYILKEIIEKGANVHHKDLLGQLALDKAGSDPARKMLLEAMQPQEGVLREQNKHMVMLKKEINKALIKAAINSQEKNVRQALANGADIDATDPIGRTALMWAIFYGHTEIVTILLSNGAQTHVTDDYGQTALSIATQEGRIEIINAVESAVSQQLGT